MSEEIKTFWMPTDNGRGVVGGIRVLEAIHYDRLKAESATLYNDISYYVSRNVELRAQLDEAMELLGEAAVYGPDTLDARIDAWLEANKP